MCPKWVTCIMLKNGFRIQESWPAESSFRDDAAHVRGMGFEITVVERHLVAASQLAAAGTTGRKDDSCTERRHQRLANVDRSACSGFCKAGDLSDVSVRVLCSVRLQES